AGTKALLVQRPSMCGRFRMVPRQALRSALLAKCRNKLLGLATDRLFASRPELSARLIASSWQGYVLGSSNVLVPLFFIFFPEFAWIALHLASSFFFLACVGLRATALTTAAPNRFAPLDHVSVAELPTYSVLVALYKEAE